jgi:8-oxo-dGTP pyrophosphatase MutT (NUDIX family)
VTSGDWAESYHGRLRALAGDRQLLFVGARCVVRDDVGRVLLIQRSDNGQWSLPAGGMELGESIAACAVRELFEETGVRATAITPFAIHSGPEYASVNMYGDHNQVFATVFRVDEWTGPVLRQTDETLDAQFFALDDLPADLTASARESLADLMIYEETGRFIVK